MNLARQRCREPAHHRLESGLEHVLSFIKARPSRWLAVTTVSALLVAGLANAEGALSLLERFTSADERALPTVSPTSALPFASTSSLAPSPGVAPSTGARADGWYELTSYRAVSWNNGFDPVDPVRIGSASFPSSIVGYYPSTSSDPMNRAIWTIGGTCDRFSVWIGKDADSGSSDGIGRFVVQADDREVFTGEMTMDDGAREVTVDISGAFRLTLFDTRRPQDAKNAWGRPRVHCTEPPGRKR
ncbi:NPCBM/NEW2 domain-containing protein [Nocardia sp. NPDC023988]|uniref:NPCBM/NEW2 domain-containing protein n=1 Tax=unclassified Nocardia TaxID=2637762 RepID=UPI0033DF147E